MSFMPTRVANGGLSSTQDPRLASRPDLPSMGLESSFATVLLDLKTLPAQPRDKVGPPKMAEAGAMSARPPVNVSHEGSAPVPKPSAHPEPPPAPSGAATKVGNRANNKSTAQGKSAQHPASTSPTHNPSTATASRQAAGPLTAAKPDGSSTALSDEVAPGVALVDDKADGQLPAEAQALPLASCGLMIGQELQGWRQSPQGLPDGGARTSETLATRGLDASQAQLGNWLPGSSGPEALDDPAMPKDGSEPVSADAATSAMAGGSHRRPGSAALDAADDAALSTVRRQARDAEALNSTGTGLNTTPGNIAKRPESRIETLPPEPSLEGDDLQALIQGMQAIKAQAPDATSARGDLRPGAAHAHGNGALLGGSTGELPLRPPISTELPLELSAVSTDRSSNQLAQATGSASADGAGFASWMQAGPMGVDKHQDSVKTEALPLYELKSHLNSPDFGKELSARMSVLAKDGVSEAQLHLNPAEMGPVSVQITVDGQLAQVHFQAEHAKTRDVLQNSLPELAAALRDQGLTLSGGGVSSQARDAGQQGGFSREREGQGSAARRSPSGRGDEMEIRLSPVTSRRTPQGVLDLFA